MINYIAILIIYAVFRLLDLNELYLYLTMLVFILFSVAISHLNLLDELKKIQLYDVPSDLLDKINERLFLPDNTIITYHFDNRYPMAFSYSYGKFNYISVNKNYIMNSIENTLSVIGHELGHIKGKHTLIKTLYTIIIFPSLVLIDNIEIFMISVFIYIIAELYVSRIMEFLADDNSVKMFGKDNMINLFCNMKESSGYEFFSTHPLLINRIRRIKNK